MQIFTPIVLIVFYTITVTSWRKCCDLDSAVKKENSTYFCDKSDDKRVQIWKKEAIFPAINKTSENYCYDINGTVMKYQIQNGKIVSELKIDENFFPKCCPIHYFYNKKTHSCKWRTNLDQSFIKQHFVKVGLPDCRVIADYQLDLENYRLELSTLYIGHSKQFREGQFCIDRDENSSLIARGCYQDLNICNSTKCIHKCCPDGQSFVDGRNCKNTYTHGLNLAFSQRINNLQDPFAIIHKYDCRIYILRDKINYYLDKEGIFWAFYNKTNSFKRFDLEEKSYCIEHVQMNNVSKFMFFMCFPEEEIQEKFLVSRWAKIISSTFIIVVMAVYLLIPEMLNLFGKILLCYCTSLLTLFIILIYGQFEINQTDKGCIISAFLSLYSSLSCFAWLNIMCIDIWCTFRSSNDVVLFDDKMDKYHHVNTCDRIPNELTEICFSSLKSSIPTIQEKDEKKKFLIYCLYGFGAPLIITLITFLAYGVFDTPYSIRPFLGYYKCFLERRGDNYGLFLYYATPLMFTQIANLILFAKTIAYCLRVKSEVNRLNDNRVSVNERRQGLSSLKQQLKLILKLSLTMGISFIFEAVSAFYDFSQNSVTKYIETVWDTFNCLQGVFIFLIFICNEKVLRLCRLKLCGERKRKFSLTSSAATGTSLTSTMVPLTSKIRTA